MKVLLLGEYSGFHTNLKEGLQELDVETRLAADGDGFKKLDSDLALIRDFGNRFQNHVAYRLLDNLLRLKHFAGYDVAQMVAPYDVFHPRLKWLLIPLIAKLNERFFLSAAGTRDPAYIHALGKFSFTPYDEYTRYGLTAPEYPEFTQTDLRWHRRLLDLVDGVIPIMYEYAVGYEGHPKRRPTIPLPINTKKIQYRSNKPGRRLVISHGLNREVFKGTYIIQEALEDIRRRYPNDVEIILEGKMPLRDYLGILERSHIVIDQCRGYSYGMNALYSMSMGKVVFGGNEPEARREFGIESCPVVGIRPDKELIVAQVERFLAQPSLVESIGHESRVFTENVHGHVKVAAQYLETWKT